MKDACCGDRATPLRLAVLGAGNGGQAMAADMSLAGHDVNLFDHERFRQNLLPVEQKGGIDLYGSSRKGFARLNLMTTNIEEAIRGVKLIMVVVPAFGHRAMAEACARFLEDGQIFVLNPGSTGGALECARVFRERGTKKKIVVAETLSLVYACRKTGPAQVRISATKETLPVAAFPSDQTEAALSILKELYPQFTPAASVLDTSLNNMNAVGHPAITLLNTGRIESTKGDFYFYRDGVTSSIGNVIQAIDQERLAIVRAFDLEPVSEPDWLFKWYGAKGKNPYEVLQACEAYKDSRAPQMLQERYVSEDVPFGLVPIASFGDLTGTPTPTMKSIIQVASVANGADYWNEGRTVEKLGISGMSIDRIREYVTHNILP